MGCRTPAYLRDVIHAGCQRTDHNAVPSDVDHGAVLQHVIVGDSTATAATAARRGLLNPGVDIRLQDILVTSGNDFRGAACLHCIGVGVVNIILRNAAINSGRQMFGVKVSQSVHPAGMVISPVTLVDNYGIFEKDGENCLMLDMDEAHEAGLAKYDFLVLKTVQVIRDCCSYFNRPYPKTHEIDWNDDAVWEDMLKSPVGVFQMEGNFAFDSLKKFKTHSIFDMSLVTACIRPSGASYREQLLARVQNHNPSELIDELLKDNLGYLVYQEDIIQFLQRICGLNGSQADSVRRGIAKKKMELLDEWMPVILNGYCDKSEHPREVAEEEAKQFLKIIEDASAYMFGLVISSFLVNPITQGCAA